MKTDSPPMLSTAIGRSSSVCVANLTQPRVNGVETFEFWKRKQSVKIKRLYLQNDLLDFYKFRPIFQFYQMNALFCSFLFSLVKSPFGWPVDRNAICMVISLPRFWQIFCSPTGQNRTGWGMDCKRDEIRPFNPIFEAYDGLSCLRMTPFDKSPRRLLLIASVILCSSILD